MGQQVNRSKKVVGHGIPNLSERTIIKLLADNPYINSFEEMCEVRGCMPESVSDEMKAYAEKKIKYNLAQKKMELRKQLKEAASKGNEGNIKALITLYQLIASDDELRRLGTANMGKKEIGVKKSEITIKSADPDMVNKLSDI